ncbi:alkaline shock response membrane anchor protein AmaP [Facklamia hominis]|uniref:alkaline shock response membrane anchor protein AmaP n=1 Tax=Facklamia hominis TaxID=178214 RepID=UPI0038FD0F9C
MKKSFKWLLLVLTIFAISLLWPNMVNYHQIATSKSLMLKGYSSIAAVSGSYIYWGSLVLVVLLVVGIIACFLMPDQQEGIELRDNRGKLVVRPNAIVGMIKALLDNEEAVDYYSSKVTVEKNKIKVYVIVSLRRTSDLYGQANQLAERIRSEIRQLIGRDYPAEVELEFKDISNEENQKFKTKSRVL